MAKKVVNEEQQYQFKQAIRRTWENIGGDVEQSAEEAGESLTLIGVAECVLDYVYMYGDLKGEDKTAWDAMNFTQHRKISLEALKGRI